MSLILYLFSFKFDGWHPIPYTIYMTGKELKKIRDDLGLSQAKLAVALGNSTMNGHRSIRNMEKGVTPISKRLVITLRALLLADSYKGE